MQITLNIFYTMPGATATLFDARGRFLLPNFGNSAQVTVELADVSVDYRMKYGDLMKVEPKWRRYSLFLADCFKYNFRITEIDGVKTRLDPFKDGYTTEKETITIEIEEMIP